MIPISKTEFIRTIKCERYIGLKEIYKKKERAVITLDDDEKVVAEALENDKLDEIYRRMYEKSTDENIEDIDLVLNKDEVELKKLSLFLDDYNMVEKLAAKKAINMYGGDVIYDEHTYNQKKFKYIYEDYEFFSFLDVYQEREKDIKVYEVKAITNSKILALNTKSSEFVKRTPENNLYFDKDVISEKKLLKLLDKYDDIGKQIYDISYERYVIEKSNKLPNKEIKYYLATLETEYLYDGRKDSDNKNVYSDDIICFIDVTWITELMVSKIDADIKVVIDRYVKKDASPILVNKHSFKSRKHNCFFHDICYAELNILEKNPIFAYIDSAHGFTNPLTKEKYLTYEMLNMGYKHMLDVDKSWLTREKNIIQRDCVLNNVEYVDRERIEKCFTKLKYPIYHLDFETLAMPIPKFFGEKPYQQSPFQFSIHIEHEPGVCDKEKDSYFYLNADNINDYRKELLEKIIDIIKPGNSTVLAYNQGFEKGVLDKLSIPFPEYKEKIENIKSRLFDLMYFLKGNKALFENFGYSKEEASLMCYYHPDMNGSYSIKKILPIFTNLSYKDLEVQNGMQAVVEFASLHLAENKQAAIDIRNNLLQYCGQDTWSMVEILKGLRNLVNN